MQVVAAQFEMVLRRSFQTYTESNGQFQPQEGITTIPARGLNGRVGVFGSLYGTYRRPHGEAEEKTWLEPGCGLPGKHLVHQCKEADANVITTII